ncbi:MAG: ATP synthase F0 subunit B [Acidobacteriaceae bacterium]|nr:ATP synthase F0 subunit B [Acidobacteriaceae bacterium]
MRIGRHFFWLALLVAVFAVAAPHAWAQETAAQETAALDAVTKWKIINTAIFAVGLGWFIWKYAPAFFNARSSDIQKAIKDATGLKIEADFRYSETDRKMAGLADEIRRIREQNKIEMERDHKRFRQETQAQIEHIRHNVAAELEAFRQEGIQQIRQRTVQLAIDSAQRRLEERLRSGEPEDLLRDFIHLVERGRN